MDHSPAIVERYMTVLERERWPLAEVRLWLRCLEDVRNKSDVFFSLVQLHVAKVSKR